MFKMHTHTHTHTYRHKYYIQMGEIIITQKQKGKMLSIK